MKFNAPKKPVDWLCVAVNEKFKESSELKTLLLNALISIKTANSRQVETMNFFKNTFEDALVEGTFSEKSMDLLEFFKSSSFITEMLLSHFGDYTLVTNEYLLFEDILCK